MQNCTGEKLMTTSPEAEESISSDSRSRRPRARRRRSGPSRSGKTSGVPSTAGCKRSKPSKTNDRGTTTTKPHQIPRFRAKVKGSLKEKVTGRKEFAGSAVQTTTTKPIAPKAKVEKVVKGAKVARAPTLFRQPGTRGDQPHGPGRRPHNGGRSSQDLGRREKASPKEKARARAAKAMRRWEARAIWATTTTTCTTPTMSTTIRIPKDPCWDA